MEITVDKETIIKQHTLTEEELRRPQFILDLLSGHAPVDVYYQLRDLALKSFTPPEALQKAEVEEAHAVLDKAEISRKRSLDGGKTWPEYTLAERIRIVCGALKIHVEPDDERATPVWDLVIAKCHSAYPERQGMSWGESPLELITEIINDRDEAIALQQETARLLGETVKAFPSPRGKQS